MSRNYLTKGDCVARAIHSSPVDLKQWQLLKTKKFTCLFWNNNYYIKLNNIIINNNNNNNNDDDDQLKEWKKKLLLSSQLGSTLLLPANVMACHSYYTLSLITILLVSALPLCCVCDAVKFPRRNVLNGCQN